MQVYDTNKLAIVLIKNVVSIAYGEQQLLTNHVSIFVILVLENSSVQKLSEMYEPSIEKQSFQTNSQIRILIFNLMQKKLILKLVACLSKMFGPRLP